jgi:NosR/NirI family transcriptional regulator, nitrous oxide reductase regulator
MFALLVMAWLGAAWATAGDSPNPQPAETFGFSADDQQLNCSTQAACARVLPDAFAFSPVPGKPYQVGLNAQGKTIGWVVLSTDVVKVNGYSGKPMSTVVGIDTEGRITGARVVHHSEPILLLGIPEQALHDFVDAYAGMRADEKMLVGRSTPGKYSVDVISGATVTVFAENKTILDTARNTAEDVGVITAAPRVPGQFVEGEPWTWAQLVKGKALGHIRVEQEEMGGPPGPVPFLDLWFGIGDPAQIGIPLLGERNWRYAVDHLAPGEHLLVVLNGGTGTFRGSGFVRGGIFDRIRVEQGLRTISFTDLDYTRIDSPPVADAPDLPEAGLFIVRDGALDPGAKYDFIFLGSTYDGKGAYSRDFRSFSDTQRLPRSIYLTEGPDPESALWRDAWSRGWPKALLVGLYFTAIGAVFAFRRWTTGNMKRLQRLHTGFMLTSFFGLGLYLHVQPSVTQILTLVGSTTEGWDWGQFLSEPVLFVSWIFIAIITLIWGRGVFCGWGCPYGAMNELTFKVGRLLKLPAYELPESIHNKLRYLRYPILVALIGAYLWDAALGETMAEVEPFKSTFFVAPWTRHWGLVLWWVVLFAVPLVSFRPFCRYICPLGAGLAIGSSARVSPPHRRNFCSKCKICTRTCEPRAIRPNGTIDARECLSCMECEANWRDDQVCPPLVKIRRDRERAKL